MTAEKAIEKAREEQGRANYLSQYGANAGIRRIYSEKVYWLSCLIHLAETAIYQGATNE